MGSNKLNEYLDRVKLQMSRLNEDYRANFIMEQDDLIDEMALNLQHDKKNNKLVVVSDLEGREANKETIKNRKFLKSNGFNWNGSNWIIDDTELDKAKGVISTANKSEYLIKGLEDLIEFVEKEGDAENKSFLKAKLETYIEDLANITDERALDSAIRKYFAFFSKFHQYSFHNRILIYIQRPDATKVASYDAWKKVNRGVKKAPKGGKSNAIWILRPIFRKDDPEYIVNPNTGKKEKNENRNPVGYTHAKVYDISDTYALNKDGEVPESPKWHGDNTPSEVASTLVKALTMLCEDMGIELTKSDAKGGEKGYSAGDHINLSSDIEGAAEASTLVHELAHELMHWKKSSIYYVGDEQRASKRIVEMQAESVSYTVLKHYDLPVKHHPTYLVLWKADKNLILSNLETISKVSQFIINKVESIISSTPELDLPTKEVNPENMNEMVSNHLNEGGATTDFQVYHRTYGSAIDEIERYANARGFELDQDDYVTSYQDGFFKPKEGHYKRDSLTIYKDGKEQRKSLQVQIYNRGRMFELNMYIN